MDFSKVLKKGTQSLYLLHGEEVFLIRQAIDYLQNQVFPPEEGLPVDFNFDRYDLDEGVDSETVAQAARTLPMMAPRRLVLVRRAEKAFELKADSPALKPYVSLFSELDESVCLVFVASKKLRADGSLYKKLVAQKGVVYEASAPRERDLPQWIRNATEERGRKMADDAANYLALAIGAELALLDAKIEQLCLQVKPPQAISLADVQLSVPQTKNLTIWAFLDAIANRQPSQVLEQLHRLLLQGEAPLGLLALVVRQFRQLLVGKSMMMQGASLEDAAQAAGVLPFKKDAFGRQVQQSYSMDELLWSYGQLEQLDRSLKSSGFDSSLLMEGTILNLVMRTELPPGMR